jgi:8-oxo-dGTP diphosphatase
VPQPGLGEHLTGAVHHVHRHPLDVDQRGVEGSGHAQTVPPRESDRAARYRTAVADTPARLGALRRTALRGYAALPKAMRLQLVRRLTPNYTVGALCLLEHDGKVLMLRQHHREGWTLPGGLVDRGETADQAVRREVMEETGLSIEAAEPLTTVIDPVTRRVDVIFHVPVEDLLEVVPRSEAVQARWLAPDQLGVVDESTGQAFAAIARVLRPDARRGRLERLS